MSESSRQSRAGTARPAGSWPWASQIYCSRRPCPKPPRRVGSPAPIVDGDVPRMGPYGPELAMCFMRPSDVKIIDTWYVTGLRASGTQDLYVEDLFVPCEMTGAFSMVDGPHPVRQSPITRLPFLTLFGLIQAPTVCLGLARHVIDEFNTI